MENLKENSELKIEFNIDQVIQYLKEREKVGGGFSFAPDLYPDIEDTYYAIRTLKILSAEINRDKTENYLKTIDWMGVGFPRTIYMLVYLHISLNMDLPDPLKELLKMDWARFQAIDSQYFFDEIRKLIHQPLIPFQPLSCFQFNPEDNLQILRKKVSILLNYGIEFNRNEMIEWVQLSQNGDGGFGFYPGTTSYMENTYCALEILSKLRAYPFDMTSCKKYILGCQTKSGGFGRAPMSFPFIESTFHAVCGWFFLKEMESESYSRS